MAMPKRVKVKIILVPVTKHDIISQHVGHVLYRTSGPLRVINATPQRMTFRWLDSELDHTVDKEFNGFYKPVGFILNKFWDEDDRYYDIRPSHYEYMESLLPKEGEVFIAGLPKPNKIRNIVHKKTIMFIGEDDGKLFKMLHQIQDIISYKEKQFETYM